MGQRRAPTARRGRRRIGRVRLPHLSDLLLMLLAAAVLAGVVFTVYRKPAGLPTAAELRRAQAPTIGAGSGPLSVWIGDGWIAGQAVGGPAAGIAALTAKKLGWSSLVDAQAASGWTGAGIASEGEPQAVPYAKRTAAAIALHPRIVFVQGGTNDASHGASAYQVAQGVKAVVKSLRAGLPAGVPLVVIGPEWVGGPPPAQVQTVRHAVVAESRLLDVPVLDPIGEHWVTGSPPTGSADPGTGTAARYISINGTDPTAAGNAAFADRVVSDLRTLRVSVPAASPSPSVTAG